MKRVLTVLSFLNILLFAGCSIIGVLSPQERFQGTNTFSLPRSDERIFDLIAEIGKDMGMGVSELNHSLRRISLSSGSSGAGMILVGSMNSSTLSIQVSEDGKTLEIMTMVLGNFGTGNQEAATKLTEEFKTRLIKKVEQK
ncbi:hypothetical protein [Candidatus Manganitrophus noduliformans]|uniref:DUF3568 family protein n=1 Tax=Candidatus Manganitrophus noduliformans TaxID=2606439 RepID=A0A7X6ICM5_9BACT|nr:hypothetical protein [Candidatus Manganitrophus noduliformans]NKE72971.1 hypothetical protein [Candidatus Manganitrophus noduliformans]